jgi:type IV secretion system protein VirD4
MDELKNTLMKMFLGVIILTLLLYANVVLFAYLVAPNIINFADTLGLLAFFVSIWNWTWTNWSLLHFDGSYVIIAGQPAVAYLLYRFFGSILATFGIGFLILMHKRPQIIALNLYKPKEKVHGDAKWATESQVEHAGLRAKEGMLLGQDDSGYYVSTGFQHSLLFAPTGSGKGVGFVIPNLLFWQDSCVVHDIKLENYDLTAGWRASIGQKCYVWSPAEPDGFTHCYNPIDWVSSKPGQMVDDVQKLANLILAKQDFWENEARSLFVGVVLYPMAFG